MELTKKEKKSIANSKYYQKNKDRLAEKWKNDEVRKEKLRVYYQKNKEIILERAREWNRKNKEQRKIITERQKKTKIQSFRQVNNEHQKS